MFFGNNIKTEDANSFLELIPIGIMLLSQKNELIMFNKLAFNLLGISIESLTSKNMIDLFEEQGLEQIINVNDSNSIYSRTKVLQLNGKFVKISISFFYSDLFKEDTKILVIENVSDFKNMEIIQKDFIETILHQLRNPLTSIKTSLSILNKSMNDLSKNDKASEILNMSCKETNRLHYLLKDLREIFYIDTKHENEELIIEKIDMARALRHIRKELFNSLPEKKVDIENIQFLIHNDFEISSEFEKFCIIIYHLIKNAIAYKNKDSIVTIKAFPEDEFINIAVCNEGVGISEEELPSIYNKFYRGEEARLIYPNGNGLGLYIVRSLVDLLNGNIYCDVSEISTNFYLSLPIN